MYVHHAYVQVLLSVRNFFAINFRKFITIKAGHYDLPFFLPFFVVELFMHIVYNMDIKLDTCVYLLIRRYLYEGIYRW